MKSILVIALSILMINICKGQNTYIPLVKENSFCINHQYLDTDHYPKPSAATLSYFNGDSIYNAKLYGKRYFSSLSGTHPCPPEQLPCFVVDEPYKPMDKNFGGLYRDDITEMKVFYIPIGNLEEVELYNFALSEGNTISEHLKILMPQEYSGEGIVDSISFDTIYGQVRKVLNFKAKSQYFPFNTYFIKVIEGIGLKCDYCEGTLADCNIVSSTKNTPDTPSNKIEIFPNPTSDYIILRSPTSISKVEIFDQNNRIVISSQSIEIDVSSLISGVYFVRCITSNNVQYYQKFIKI